MTTFGRRLHQERVRLGHSQQQFAELGGVKRSSQHLYEHDVRRPDVGYLSRIHAAGADVGFLISGHKSAASTERPMLSVADALTAFRAVNDFANLHEKDVVASEERERLFQFVCAAMAAEPDSVGLGELQSRLAERWAS